MSLSATSWFIANGIMGQIVCSLMLGGNPVFTAPANLKFPPSGPQCSFPVFTRDTIHVDEYIACIRIGHINRGTLILDIWAMGRSSHRSTFWSFNP